MQLLSPLMLQNITAIPPSAFYGPEHKTMGSSFIRCCFIKVVLLLFSLFVLGVICVLRLAQLKTLAERRDDLCMKYMERMKCSDHPLNDHLLPRLVADICHYNLRRHSE